MMTRGPEEVKAHIQAIDGNDAATVKDEDMLTTLEVCYEFYLRGFPLRPWTCTALSRNQVFDRGRSFCRLLYPFPA